MASETLLKRWGNSLAFIVPREEVIEKNLSENDRVRVEIFKEADFSDVFGTLKTKVSGQDFKKEVKKGWK